MMMVMTTMMMMAVAATAAVVVAAITMMTLMMTSRKKMENIWTFMPDLSSGNTIVKYLWFKFENENSEHVEY